MDRVRRLAYRYLELSRISRVRLARELDVLPDSHLELNDQVFNHLVIDRVLSGTRLTEFEKRVFEASE